MPNNMILLETIALTQAAASVTFDNLPTSGYTDLKVVISARHSTTSADMYLRFNNLTTNLSDRVVYGLGASTTGSNAVSNIRLTINSGSSTANTFGNSEVYIPNYRSAVAHPVSVDSVAEDNGTTNNIMWLGAGLWNSATAITSIELALSTGNFAANSTFSLYGIAALGTTPVLAPKATGGNSIENNGTYWIHTFTSSGIFTPQTNLACDYLVVAGGGGGGARRSGGGGAGGYQTSTLSVTATTYNVTVGAGGAGGANAGGGVAFQGTTGSNSIFSSITSDGGGGGASQNGGLTNGINGGSGGGASRAGTAGTGVSGQGNAGGTGQNGANPDNGGGGGGGSGGAGGNMAVGATGGTGGAGSSSSITGSAVTRAWGGVGGGFTNMGTAASGSQGNAAGASAAANSGGGGNGTVEDSLAGGSGGSGIVIIRYPIA